MFGCVAAQRMGTIESEIAAVKAQLDVDATIGGGGDSITAWMYAAIVGASVLYPMIWRPLVRKTGLRKKGES